mmetsp:Transcript_26049/g.42018  ORF Transcript_26049/g.42018 Transcript_26049/m.42018 type:complete len:264 (-) Transcript_26049:506-1297(-)
MFGRTFHVLKFTHTERQQVCAHLGCFLKHHQAPLPAIQQDIRRNRHVSQGNQTIINCQRCLESCLSCWLVNARKTSSRVKCLELGRDHNRFISFGICIPTSVKSSHLVVMQTNKVNRQNAFSFRKFFPKCECNCRASQILDNLFAFNHLAIPASKRRLRALKLLSVQNNLLDAFLLHLCVNINLAIKPKIAIQINIHLDLIAHRVKIRRQRHPSVLASPGIRGTVITHRKYYQQHSLYQRFDEYLCCAKDFQPQTLTARQLLP